MLLCVGVCLPTSSLLLSTFPGLSQPPSECRHPLYRRRWQIQSMVPPWADTTCGFQLSFHNSLVLVCTALPAGPANWQSQHSRRELLPWPICQRLSKSIFAALKCSDPLCKLPPRHFHMLTYIFQYSARGMANAQYRLCAMISTYSVTLSTQRVSASAPGIKVRLPICTSLLSELRWQLARSGAQCPFVASYTFWPTVPQFHPWVPSKLLGGCHLFQWFIYT